MVVTADPLVEEAVAEDRIDPADQIPEADLLEQQTPLAPRSLIDTESASVISDSRRHGRRGGLGEAADTCAR